MKLGDLAVPGSSLAEFTAKAARGPRRGELRVPPLRSAPWSLPLAHYPPPANRPTLFPVGSLNIA